MRKKLLVFSITILLALSFLTILPSVGAEPNSWWNTNWDYKKKITIDSSKVAGDLTNFPILIHVTDTDFKNHARIDGYDFVFVDSTESIEYYWELENYNSTTGELIAWVNITELDGDANQDLYCYYGNPDANTNPSSSSTWDSHYKMVWHMDDLTTSTVEDSTSNNNDGVKELPENPLEYTVGKINKAQDFTDDHIVIPFGINPDYTVEFWTKIADITAFNVIFSYGRTYVLPTGVCMSILDNNIIIGNENYSKGLINNNIHLTNNVWSYWVNVIDAIDDIDFYLDGIIRVLDDTVFIRNDFGIYGIGERNDGSWRNGLTGQIDEVRISDSLRSADWISTSHNTQNSPSTFMTFGSEQEPLPNNPPDKPTCISPSDTATNISIYTTLKVHVIDINDDTMTVSFYWSDDTLIETVTTIQNDTDAETSSLNLNRLIEYSWYAVANDSLSETQSYIFTFTTEPEPNYSPIKPTCVSPLHNSIDVSITTTLTVHVIDMNNDSMMVDFYYDNSTWSTSYNSLESSIFSLMEYNGKLYAGSSDNGIIYVYDGLTWSISYDSPENKILSLAEYDAKLYAGSGNNGIIYVYDGSTWSISYNSPEMFISSLAEYSDKLYAGSFPNALVYVYDGNNWNISHDSPESMILSLAEYDGKLYAGIDEIIYVYDGSTWSTSYDSSQTYIYSLAEYDGKLYVGSCNNGIIYVYDGSTWSTTYDSPQTYIYSLAEYDGKLYAGSSVYGEENGIIYEYEYESIFIQHFDNQVNDTDVQTSSLSLNSNTIYSWYAIANDSLLETQSDTFTFTTGETAIPVFEHVIPMVLPNGYLFMIYRNGNINLSNLNLLMGSYSPFTVCKFNYTSSDWDCEVITINSNDYIRVKINESDMPYTDTLIPVSPQIRFKITDADEGDKLNITVKSNSSGSWIVVKEWSNVSEGWFSCTDSNMDEYNTTYYYSINVTDSYDNNLFPIVPFITTSTEPTIPPITPSIDIYIYGITGIVILLGGGMYILSKKKRRKFK